jgi:maltose alpha-D-glucosyltransferase/alpha-amylase
LLSLGPHGFYWFCISCRDKNIADDESPALPFYRARAGWEELFDGRARKALGEALEPYMRRQRWFAGKARTLQAIEVADAFDIQTPSEAPPFKLLLISTVYTEGEPETYVLPVTLLDDDVASELRNERPSAGIMHLAVANVDRSFTMCEATSDERLWRQLLWMIASRRSLRGRVGTLSGICTGAFERLSDGTELELPLSVHGGEERNASAVFDERFILKMFRRVTQGLNPDFEIGRQLTDHESPLPIIPQLAGGMEYSTGPGRRMSIAVLHEFVPSVGNAWKYTLDELDRYFERVQTRPHEHFAVGDVHPQNLSEMKLESLQTETPQDDDLLKTGGGLLELIDRAPSALAQETIGAYLSWAELLGQRTGEVHVALAQTDGGPAFRPEPFTRLYQRGLYQSMRSQARATLDMLRTRRHRLNDDVRRRADQLLQCEPSLLAKFARLTRDLIDAHRIRCHGDMHLGQVLFTGKDFVFTNFEGDLQRPVSERRIKASAFRDVAGMLRSFRYAAHAALRGQTSALIIQHPEHPAEAWAAFWNAWVSATFLRTYLKAAGPGNFLPTDREPLDTLLSAYVLERALAELRGVLNNRPDWAGIPLDGILQLCSDKPEPTLHHE